MIARHRVARANRIAMRPQVVGGGVALPPSPPTNLVATPTSTDIGLVWTPPAGVLTSQRTEYSDDDAVWHTLDTVSAGATSDTDATATPGVRRYYRVKATNAGGTSTPSNEDSAIRFVLPLSLSPDVYYKSSAIGTAGAAAGTYAGTPAWTADVPTSRAANVYSTSLNATDQNVSVPGSVFIEPAIGDGLGQWFKTSSAAVQHLAVINASGVIECYTYITAGTVHFVQLNVANGFYCDLASATAAYADGAWHFAQWRILAGTRAELFLDGISVASATSFTGTVRPHQADSVIYLGGSGPASFTFTGKLSTCLVFDTYLSDADIAACYANTALSGTPLAAYDLNENTGAVARDSSGNMPLYVDTFTDQSGNANHTTQQTDATKRPCAHTQHGSTGATYTAVSAVAADTPAPSPVAKLSISTPVVLGTTYTIGGILAPRGWPAAGSKMTLLGGADANNFPLAYDVDHLYHKAGGNQVSFAHTVCGCRQVSWLIKRTNTSVALYINGVQLGTTQTLGANSSLTASTLYQNADATQKANVDIVELFTLAGTAASDAQIAGLHSYWATTYHLPTVFPVPASAAAVVLDTATLAAINAPGPWPDGQMGIRPARAALGYAAGTKEFLASRGTSEGAANQDPNSTAQTTGVSSAYFGTLDNPIAAGPLDGGSYGSNANAPVVTGIKDKPHYYIGGGPTYEKIGDPLKVLCCYHMEKHPANDASNFWASLGLEYSTDGGANFTDLGTILRPWFSYADFATATNNSAYPGQFEIGNGPMVLSPDGLYLYVYFTEFTAFETGAITIPYPNGIRLLTFYPSVARCPLADVWAAASLGNAPTFSKWSGGNPVLDSSWTENGLTGLGAAMMTGRREGGPYAPDVAYHTPSGKYLMVSPIGGAWTHRGLSPTNCAGIYAYLSANGVTGWSPAFTLGMTPDAVSGNTYPSLAWSGSDGQRKLGNPLYQYWMSQAFDVANRNMRDVQATI